MKLTDYGISVHHFLDTYDDRRFRGSIVKKYTLADVAHLGTSELFGFISGVFAGPPGSHYGTALDLYYNSDYFCKVRFKSGLLIFTFQNKVVKYDVLRQEMVYFKYLLRSAVQDAISVLTYGDDILRKLKAAQYEAD